MPYFYMGFEMVSALVQPTTKLSPPKDTKSDLPAPAPAVVVRKSKPKRQPFFAKPLSSAEGGGL